MGRKILFIFIIGLLLRLAYVVFVPQYEIKSDAKGYTVLARSMLEGKGYSITAGKPDIHWPPGYPLFVAAVYKVCGVDNNVAVRIVQSILTSLLILMVYFIAKKIFNVKIGFIASALTCFYPAFITYSGFLCPQTIAAFLLPLFILSAMYLKRSFLASLCLGVVAGYATLVRPELFLCFLAIFAVLFLKSGQKRHAIKFILGAAVVMGLVISMWTARNYRVAHRFIPISAHLGDTIWLSTWKGDWQEWHASEEPLASILKGRDFAQADQDLLRAGINNLKEHPFIYLKLCIKRLFRLWVEGHSWTVYRLTDSTANYLKQGNHLAFSVKLFLLIFNTAVVFLGFCGIRIAYKKFTKNSEYIGYLTAPVLYFVVFYCLTFSTGRYSVPVLPLMIIFASCAIGCVFKKYYLIIPYIFLFLFGIQALFHGFPDVNRFFEEWMDERFTLTTIMKFGTLNFAPTQIIHPPLYHYLTFIPIAIFFIIGKATGFFHDKIEFVRFYFNNTHYFFFIGRTMSYIFYWAAAFMIFKSTRLFFNRMVSHIAALSYLLIPQFVFYASATYPDTLLILNSSVFFYFILKFYSDGGSTKYLYASAFFLGVATATKYNALFLGVLFIPLFIVYLLNQTLPKRNLYAFLRLCVLVGFFVFAGFVICHPFFVLQFKTYLHNRVMENIATKYYWQDTTISGPPILRHLKEFTFFHNINPVGFLILLFGCWGLFRRYKKLSLCIFFTFLVFEIYFGIYLSNCAPLRYLNPLVPLAVLIFAAGVDFIINKRGLFAILPIFMVIVTYHYVDIVKGISMRPTHIQRARAFIEESIPEFANICIIFPGYLPQLNMTRQSYFHFINTVPPIRQIPGHELAYKPMDNPEGYDPVLREIRVESMIKRPQFNLVRLDRNVATFQDLKNFLKKENIEYVLTTSEITKEAEEINNRKVLTLIKRFAPVNKRIYKIEHIDLSVFLYKVNREKL